MNSVGLMHFGVKGMKWGVRRERDQKVKPVKNNNKNEPNVLLKGSKISSVSSRYKDADSYKKSGKWMYTYDSFDKWDNAVYKGPFSKYLIMYRGAKFVAEHKYETTRDLKIPTRKERINAFVKLYNSDPKKYGKELEEVQSLLNQYKIDGKSDRSIKYGTGKLDSKHYEEAYDAFNHAMENIGRYEITKEYATKMASKYDGMIDDNNKGTYNRANNPFIIFDPEHSLKKAGNTKYSTIEDVIDNYNIVEKKLNKTGESVLL